MSITTQQMIAFEKEIEAIYKTGVITGPIHLRNGNEQYIVDIFKHEYNLGDYILSTWASHLHALAAGIPPDQIKNKILLGKSITLMFPEHKFYSSAIVGGICPIAIGLAKGIRLTNPQSTSKVIVFLGDMACMTGIANECMRYAEAHELPILWIIEDNSKSVGTPTRSVWSCSAESYLMNSDFITLAHYTKRMNYNENIIMGYEGLPSYLYYRYNLDYPHSGIGQFVSF